MREMGIFQQRIDQRGVKRMEMKLIDVVGDLASFDGENTSEPWTAVCEAIVSPESEMLPVTLERLKMKYFLGVFIARDFLDDWTASVEKSRLYSRSVRD
jgi:hypothetical protein